MNKPKIYLLFILVITRYCVPAPAQASTSGYQTPLFSFGVITDAQYGEYSPSAGRHYAQSLVKLQEAIDTFNLLSLDFVIQLGDLIEKDFKNFDTVLSIYHRLKAPTRHVLGNHDYQVADSLKHLVPAKLGLQSTWYKFTRPGWRFIVLDGNDLSFYAPGDSARQQETMSTFNSAKAAEKTNAKEWNGALSTHQFKWLKEELDLAQGAEESVIIFSHFPVWPPDKHNVWNDKDLLGALGASPAVRAYVSGHNHTGGYGRKGIIHFITLNAMVNTREYNAFAVVDVYADKMVIKGFGREPSRELPFKKAPLKWHWFVGSALLVSAFIAIVITI